MIDCTLCTAETTDWRADHAALLSEFGPFTLITISVIILGKSKPPVVACFLRLNVG